MAVKSNNIYIYIERERAKRKTERWSFSATLELMVDCTFSKANRIERGNGKPRANQSIRQLE